MTFYVSYITEYPIYEPAEGGYYYTGTCIEKCVEFKSWKEANKLYQAWRKEFLIEHAYHMDRVHDIESGGCGKHRYPHVVYSSIYIGDGERVQMTRTKPKERGWMPYC